jgi:chemotaxis protein MotA
LYKLNFGLILAEFVPNIIILIIKGKKMDIASLIGLVGCLGMIAGAMISSGGIGMFVDVPSLLIVIGGTFFAVMYRSTLPTFLSSFGTLVKIFLPGTKKHDELITRLTELAGIARKDGMMALEGQEVPDKFFEKGLQMLVDGADETKLTAQLNREIKAMKARHEDMTGVFQAWVDLAPAMGMIGTLVGLVAMLGNMADPKAIGPAMAVALLTTLYGAMVANCIFMPVVTKLEGYSTHELLYREMVVMGLKFISRGESPRNITDQLVANLPPKIQAKLEAEAA